MFKVWDRHKISSLPETFQKYSKYYNYCILISDTILHESESLIGQAGHGVEHELQPNFRDFKSPQKAIVVRKYMWKALKNF